MPNKFLERKGITLRKQKYKVGNWSTYNKALKKRGDIEIWLAEEVIEQWYARDRVYDGTGTPDLYTDLAITTCHEIRKVFRLPLRQTEGFINSLFRQKKLSVKCPEFTTLSKRLEKLGVKKPRYTGAASPNYGSASRETEPENPVDFSDCAAIAIDSTGLKRFGRNEWHQEKHKVSAKRSWRKLHIAVDGRHFIHGCELTDKFVSDDTALSHLVEQIAVPVEHCTADGAYDKNHVYQELSEAFPEADIVIPPVKGAIISLENHAIRNRNVSEIDKNGRMSWQRKRKYGRRNKSELCIQRYKKIFGDSMQARGLTRQKQEAKITCGALNKMTALGMPQSYRTA